MAYMKIHCDSCGETWEIYGRDNWKAETARQCPHCFQKIDRTIWEKNIILAFSAARDANAELHKAHTGEDKPLFSVDFIADEPLIDLSEFEPEIDLMDDLEFLNTIGDISEDF